MGNAERNGPYYTEIQLVSKNILPFQRHAARSAPRPSRRGVEGNRHLILFDNERKLLYYE
jgi:hypothetical protein